MSKPLGRPRLVALGDAEFAALYREIGPSELSRRTGISERGVHKRREYIENKIKQHIVGPRGPRTERPTQFPGALFLDVQDGFVLVGSDAHIWPGPKTPAMRGFIKFAKELKPKAIVMNGDVMDFPSISKHSPIGWEKWPTPKQEIEAAQETLHEVAGAAGRARKLWPLGNHDARFESAIAIKAPEYADIHGVHLRDHFPLWEPCWSTVINPDTEPVIIKHRFKGGDHAPWNNVIKAGEHMITSHLHSAKVIPFTTYRRTLYGVDIGCLADINAKAFINYTEGNPKNWRSGFCVLSFRDGKLLQPQLALVHDEKRLDYCGDLIAI